MKILTWAADALLAATSLAAGLGIPTASADDHAPTVNSCSSGPETKPSEMTIICDNTLRVDKITWSNWNAVRASGRTPIYTPVAITLEGASAPDFRFTSATITSLTTGEVHSYPLGG
jgi:hypothetical protein